MAQSRNHLLCKLQDWDLSSRQGRQLLRSDMRGGLLAYTHVCTHTCAHACMHTYAHMNTYACTHTLKNRPSLSCIAFPVGFEECACFSETRKSLGFSMKLDLRHNAELLTGELDLGFSGVNGLCQLNLYMRSARCITYPLHPTYSQSFHGN